MFIVLRPTTAEIRTRELATKPQTNERSCLWFSFLMPDWLFFCKTIAFQKYFSCSQFSRFDCNISLQDLVHTRLYGNKRAKWTIKMRNSFPVSATGPETLWCLCLWQLTSLPCKKQALPEELNKADCCQYLQHLSVLLRHCTGFYGKQRKIERLTSKTWHNVFRTNRISYFLEKSTSLKDSCSCNKNMTSSCILNQRCVPGFNQN